MANWDDKIPTIRGNLAIINNTEDPKRVLFERLRGENGSEVGREGVGKVSGRGHKGVRKRSKSYPDRRFKFTPNIHVRGILHGLKLKYGAKHMTYFINRAIELYAKRVDAEVE